MSRSRTGTPRLHPIATLLVVSLLVWPLARTVQATTIDILLVYDTTATTWTSSNGGMAAFSADVVNRMNQAMQNSGLDIDFRLVHAMPVDYNTTSFGDDLQALQTGGGVFTSVHISRDDYGADLVAMLVDTGSAYGTVGLGYTLSSWSGEPDYGFTVSSVRSVAISHTLTHEVGHNLGAHHSKYQAYSPGPNPHLDNQYSAGWYFTGDDGNPYHTIMAYNADGYGGLYQSAPLFSTPLKTYRGAVAGDALDGDNRRLLDQTREIIAAYRSASPVLPSAPVAIAASGVSTTGFTANWNPVSEASGYRLDVATSSDFSSYVPGYQDLDVGATASQSVIHLAAATAYYYRVRAYNDSGTSGSSNSIRVTTHGGVLSDPYAFTAQQYRDFLGREGAASEVAFWAEQLQQGRMTRGQVVDFFFSSPEFQNKIAPVARLYFAYFNRVPDYGGLMFWIQEFQSGTSLNAISQSFADSNEFQTTYGALDDRAFVELVYRNLLGRDPDAGGFDYWIGRLAGGLTRGEMMTLFSESNEYRNRSYRWVQVTMIYIGMLRRAPDRGGFDFWVGELTAGRSVLDLINGFLDSPEYAARFQ